MRSKRLLTILIVLCMLISTLSPAVYAAQPAVNSTDSLVTTDKGDSGLNAPEDASSNVPTLKNDALVSSKVEVNESTGQWNITEIACLGANLFSSETPECLEELKEPQSISKLSITSRMWNPPSTGLMITPAPQPSAAANVSIP